LRKFRYTADLICSLSLFMRLSPFSLSIYRYPFERNEQSSAHIPADVGKFVVKGKNKWPNGKNQRYVLTGNHVQSGSVYLQARGHDAPTHTRMCAHTHVCTHSPALTLTRSFTHMHTRMHTLTFMQSC
jgi:hypothetical protein